MKYEISWQLLEQKGACSYQVRLFKKTFPDGIQVIDLETIAIAAAAGLRLGWFVLTFFGPVRRRRYLKAFYDARESAEAGDTGNRERRMLGAIAALDVKS